MRRISGLPTTPPVRPVPMHHARYVADRLRDADLVVLRNVGHLHTAARWREFLQWVAEQHN
jgi:pimeloyl-ACP methyl ester carboxylesterase